MIVTFAKEALSSRPDGTRSSVAGSFSLRYAAKHEAESRGKLGVDHVQQIEISLAGRVVQVFAGRTAEIENIPSFIGENDRRVEMLASTCRLRSVRLSGGWLFLYQGAAGRRFFLGQSKKFSTARWGGLWLR